MQAQRSGSSAERLVVSAGPARKLAGRRRVADGAPSEGHLPIGLGDDAVRGQQRQLVGALGQLEDGGLLRAHEVGQDLLDGCEDVAAVQRAEPVAGDVEVRQVRVLALHLHELLREAPVLPLDRRQLVPQPRLLPRPPGGSVPEGQELVLETELLLLEGGHEGLQGLVLAQ